MLLCRDHNKQNSTSLSLYLLPTTTTTTAHLFVLTSRTTSNKDQVKKQAMPHIMDNPANDSDDGDSGGSTPTTLPFPPVTKQHILHCSVGSWYPKFRNVTPKTRIIPLTQAFMNYLHADSIILPDDDDADYDEEKDVSKDWRELHQTIKATISELDGAVLPKLNWSAPKDAANMNANTMICRFPREICLLLKSSDFVSHDLDNAFDGCVDANPDSPLSKTDIPYVLVLRKAVMGWNPSVEFRCFVRNKKLLCISQREKGLFPFLHNMRDKLQSMIKVFFETRLSTFEDDNFVFDVYVPNPYTQVWLVDINPWAPRTDPLLYSWTELHAMDGPLDEPEVPDGAFLRMTIDPAKREEMEAILASQEAAEKEEKEAAEHEDVEEMNDPYLPELRLVKPGDPEANLWASGQYSAYKLPLEVVNAGQSPEGIAQMARDWKELINQQQPESDDSDYE